MFRYSSKCGHVLVLGWRLAVKKIRSYRIELEKEHHVLTESWVHQVSFEYSCHFFIFFVVFIDDAVIFVASIIKFRSGFTRYIISLGRFRSNNILKQATNRKIVFWWCRFRMVGWMASGILPCGRWNHKLDNNKQGSHIKSIIQTNNNSKLLATRKYFQKRSNRNIPSSNMTPSIFAKNKNVE